MVNPLAELGRSYHDNHLDIIGAGNVEIQVNHTMNGKVIWINIDGICNVRICRIKGFVSFEDQIHETRTEVI